MAKEKKELTDELLDNINGGAQIDFGKWSFDIKCPFCGKDDQLQQGMQMYSDQSGMTIIWCLRCEKPFALDSNGNISQVQPPTRNCRW